MFYVNCPRRFQERVFCERKAEADPRATRLSVEDVCPGRGGLRAPQRYPAFPDFPLILPLLPDKPRTAPYWHEKPRFFVGGRTEHLKGGHASANRRFLGVRNGIAGLEHGGGRQPRGQSGCPTCWVSCNAGGSPVRWVGYAPLVCRRCAGYDRSRSRLRASRERGGRLSAWCC